MKKITALLLCLTLALAVFCGCSEVEDETIDAQDELLQEAEETDETVEEEPSSEGVADVPDEGLEFEKPANGDMPDGDMTFEKPSRGDRPEGDMSFEKPAKGDMPSGGFVQETEEPDREDEETFGEDLSELGINDGYFETTEANIKLECVSGTRNAYKFNNNVLTFTSVSEDTVYSISGQLTGSIVIDTGDDYKFELELNGLSLVSTDTNPITILSGDKATLTAKKDSESYIYDKREAVDDSDESLTKGAIHSEVDLKLGGKGSLSVVSDNNNGIHGKDDLEVKNLKLTVVCKDNALKGNDSVEITDCTLSLIATQGDGIKTSSSDISSKGNQRGTVTVTNSNVTIYAACDGIDAAYDAVIDGESTVLNIYTDKYSNYSEEVTVSDESAYYIRYTSENFKFSVQYYNSDSDCEWVDAVYHSTVSGDRSSYYYYSVPKKSGYSKLRVFVYSSDMTQGQDGEYYLASEFMTLNTAYDTIALTYRGGGMSFNWTNYTTTVQQGGFGFGGGHGGGMGGMGGGNTDKGDHSTKGIKAANEIVINGGSINIKSYDDSLHADNTTALENGETPLGNITINGGKLTIYSNDDAAHAEGTVFIKGGAVEVTNSYEGIEGMQVVISGGDVSVYAKDDGINATATSGTGVTLSGGFVYVYCKGDGIDANSRSSYTGISFEGGDAVIITNSSGNSAIDTEQGYSYTSGSIVAIMPRGGMTSEATHCRTFSSVGTAVNMSLATGDKITVSGDLSKSFTMPCTISNAYVITLNKGISVSK